VTGAVRSAERIAALPARWCATIAVGTIAAFLAATYARGPDSFVRVNDHLDGMVPLYAVLAETQPVIGSLDDRVGQIFDGLPRNSMPSTLHLGALLYYALTPFWAHVVHEIVTRLLAFAGMALLLRRHLLPEANALVLYGSSVCFALLPFTPSAYLSIAGQPLLLYALLNLRRGRGSGWDWLVVALFPLYSSLVFVGFFILLGLGVLVLRELWRTRRIPAQLVAAGVLLALLYAGSEYRLLYQTLFDAGHVSHRSEFVHLQGSLLQVAYAGLQNLFGDHHHAPSLQLPFLLAAAAAAVGAGVAEIRQRDGSLGPRALRRALRGPSPPGSRWRELVIALSLCGAASLLAALWQWRPVQAVVELPVLGLLRMFNFHRVTWFQPTLFGLAFAFALHELLHRRWAGPAAVVALVCAQIAWATWSSNGLAEKRYSGLSFSAYYSTPLFDEIRAHIARPPGTYRVVSLGFTPTIALYNGFWVLDGFINDYPVEYKHRFRRVIARELEKDSHLRAHFDEWGGHVDLLSSELGKVSGYSRRMYTKHAERRAVERLEIDVSALRELGADYVLSAVEIRNHAELGLVLEGRFERADSPWQIFLYSVPVHAARSGRSTALVAREVQGG
jgi:hypothetical protein